MKESGSWIAASIFATFPLKLFICITYINYNALPKLGLIIGLKSKKFYSIDILSISICEKKIAIKHI